MSTTKTTIDYSKAFTYLLSITLGVFAWFGKVSYDKLNSIETKLEALLVENGVQKTEINNLKERFDKMQPCSPDKDKNNKSISVHSYQKEGILPKSISTEEDNSLAIE